MITIILVVLAEVMVITIILVVLAEVMVLLEELVVVVLETLVLEEVVAEEVAEVVEEEKKRDSPRSRKVEGGGHQGGVGESTETAEGGEEKVTQERLVPSISLPAFDPVQLRRIFHELHRSDEDGTTTEM